jgi:hypothetical protein
MSRICVVIEARRAALFIYSRPRDGAGYFLSSFANTVCVIVGKTSSRFFGETTMIGTRISLGGLLPSR